MSSITSSESKASSRASLESLILDPLTETLASDTISPHLNDTVSPPSPEPSAVTPASSPTMAKPSLIPEEATQLTFGRIPRPLAVQLGTVTVAKTVMVTYAHSLPYSQTTSAPEYSAPISPEAAG
ncbi:uncharacterized protein LOC141538190 [Cotesia typhae]|uniref:uncharacterized protein LOC141538190 n=1 Tax=Cotesia typhae TaxID=2053667 RepID=UPI003D685B3E